MGKSDSFAINQEVRQVENLSLLLFALFVNDLECYLIENGCNFVNKELNFDERITEYLKLLHVLKLYADTTVVFADNKLSLQKALDSLENYCKMWKLDVNCDKTKVLVHGVLQKKKQITSTLLN